jgi:hypothetical protein
MTVGHTHCDVDQMFSRFAPKLRVENIWTLEDMVRVCREAFTKPVPVFFKIQRVRVLKFRLFIYVLISCL